jgi:hypothetical protein
MSPLRGANAGPNLRGCRQRTRRSDHVVSFSPVVELVRAAAARNSPCRTARAARAPPLGANAPQAPAGGLSKDMHDRDVTLSVSNLVVLALSGRFRFGLDSMGNLTGPRSQKFSS